MIMEQHNRFPVTKVFLYSLVVSIGLTALLGIMAILSGRWSWFEIRILLTTIAIGGASICGLANAAYLATRRGWIMPLVGVGVSVLSGLMIIYGMWVELGSVEYWKLATSLSIYSVALAHLSLLSMARLADWFQWSLVAAYVTILGVATIIVLMILGETSSMGMFQLLGVVAIFDAAITILIPIFHKLSQVHEAAKASGSGNLELAAIDNEIAGLKARIEELERKKKSLS